MQNKDLKKTGRICQQYTYKTKNVKRNPLSKRKAIPNGNLVPLMNARNGKYGDK